MASSNKSSMSFAVVLVIVNLGYTFYAYQSGFAIKHIQWVYSFLSPLGIPVGDLLSDNTIGETFVLSMGMAAFMVVTAFILFQLSAVVSRYLFWPNTQSNSIEYLNRHFGKGQSQYHQVIFLTPEVIKTKRTSPRESMKLDFPIPKVRMLVKKNKAIADKAKDASAIEKLELTGFAILDEHSAIPAAVTGHHAGTSLKDHTIRVVRNMDKLSDDPLRRVLALWHDIGKVFAYKKEETHLDGKKEVYWSHKFKNHDQASINMLRLTPEFKQLRSEDRAMLMNIMVYKHYTRLPDVIKTNARALDLMHKLKQADSLAVTSEISDSAVQADDDLRTPVIRALRSGGINRADASNVAFFWSNEPVMIVLAGRLMQHLIPLVPQEVANRLQFDIEPKQGQGVRHPGVKALVETFKALSILQITDFNEAVSPIGLYQVKVGKIPFRQTLALNVEELRKYVPEEEMASWGHYEYPMGKVLPE